MQKCKNESRTVLNAFVLEHIRSILMLKLLFPVVSLAQGQGSACLTHHIRSYRIPMIGLVLGFPSTWDTTPVLQNDSVEGGLTPFWELSTVILNASKDFDRVPF